VKEFRPDEADVAVDGNLKAVPYDAAFVLIGADAPTGFSRRLRIAMEGARQNAPSTGQGGRSPVERHEAEDRMGRTPCRK